jgi:hypothetical protein
LFQLLNNYLCSDYSNLFVVQMQYLFFTIIFYHQVFFISWSGSHRTPPTGPQAVATKLSPPSCHRQAAAATALSAATALPPSCHRCRATA